jgi:predicted kinase
MECIIFMGIQATGKSAFYKERFFRTHMHINLDMLRTRFREKEFLQTCVATKTRFVVDNTNLSQKERQTYIMLAKDNDFRVIGYYFQSKVTDAIRRNAVRPENERIPEKGIYGAAKVLEQPSFIEGFDELWYVELGMGGFVVKAWDDAL